MTLQRETFIENYLDELHENLQDIDHSIIALHHDSENDEHLKKVLRLFHSIKGSSRMLKFSVMEEMSHGIENVLKGISDARYPFTRQIEELVFITTDYMRTAAGEIKNSQEDSFQSDQLLSVFDQAASGEPFSLEALRKNREEQSTKETSSDSLSDGAEEDESIRINVKQVNSIVRDLNSLIIRQFQFKKQQEIVQELEDVLHTLESMKIKHSLSDDFNSQMGRGQKLIQRLKKDFLEEMPLLERQTFQVQEDVLALRMLPLDIVLGTLPKMVEELSIQQEKEISLEISGSDTRIDKFILENIHDPILHIIRNAVDHGIEPPEKRIEQDKPAKGTITIHCKLEGGNIVIRIKDDGSGIKYDSLRRKALRLYPDRKDEIEAMEESSLNSFLFQSGFSTKEKADTLSGRGVGLDIVKNDIEKIKGKITLSSEEGNGTEFTLSVPLSLSTVEGVFIISGDHKFLIPSNFVNEILIIDTANIVELVSRKAYKLRDRVIPFFPFTSLFQTGYNRIQDKSFMIIIEAYGEETGIVVDSVLRFSSLVQKPLPSNLTSLQAIRGVVFDESFSIVPILHMPDVITRFKKLKNIDERRKYSPADKTYKRILLVDDSLTTREIEKSILELEDYNVTTAVDGIDGLEKADSQYYHLIITDIQMPRMDGLTFVDNLKKRNNYRNTPVIVVSSTRDNELEQKFRRLGVEAFIVKSEFERGNLISEVKKLIG